MNLNAYLIQKLTQIGSVLNVKPETKNLEEDKGEKSL